MFLALFLTSPVAMATAHTLAKMRDQTFLWLTLTLAKNGRAPKHK